MHSILCCCSLVVKTVLPQFSVAILLNCWAQWTEAEMSSFFVLRLLPTLPTIQLYATAFTYAVVLAHHTHSLLIWQHSFQTCAILELLHVQPSKTATFTEKWLRCLCRHETNMRCMSDWALLRLPKTQNQDPAGKIILSSLLLVQCQISPKPDNMCFQYQCIPNHIRWF